MNVAAETILLLINYHALVQMSHVSMSKQVKLYCVCARVLFIFDSYTVDIYVTFNFFHLFSYYMVKNVLR